MKDIDLEAQEIIETPDKVENMVSALNRLAAGAGKKTMDGRSYDICTIEPTYGYAFNGIVYTKVLYDFGISATVSASLLRSILSHLNNPTIKETDKTILLRSGGKSFRLAKLPGKAFKPSSEESQEDPIQFNGGQLKKLLVAAPTIAGHNAFPGVLASPNGYAACEAEIVGGFLKPGPNYEVVMPRELVAILPSVDLQLSRIQTSSDGAASLIKIRATDGSEWYAPPLCGNFPDWKGVLDIPCDRTAKVACKDLADALKATTLLAKDGWLEINNSSCTVSTNTASHSIASDGSTVAKASFATLEKETKWICVNINLKRLLNITECLGSAELELASTDKADRLVVSVLTGQPYKFVLANRQGVRDKTHAYKDRKEIVD